MTVPVRMSGCTYMELADGAFFQSSRVLRKGELLAIVELFSDLADRAPPEQMRATDLWPREHVADLTAMTLGIYPSGRVIFTCALCDAPTEVAPESGPAYCHAHCPDHDYRYERGGGHLCVTCNQQAPDDWYEHSRDER